MQTKHTANIKAIKLFLTKEKMQIGMLIITFNTKKNLKFCRKQNRKENWITCAEKKAKCRIIFHQTCFPWKIHDHEKKNFKEKKKRKI